MRSDGSLVSGTSIALDIELDIEVYHVLDVGVARNYASSQAYVDKYSNNPNIIPEEADQGLEFQKVAGDVYELAGF